jgi:hypothetical protein
MRTSTPKAKPPMPATFANWINCSVMQRTS